MTRSQPRLSRLAAVGALLMVLGCGETTPFEPQLTNTTDDLLFQVSGVSPGVNGAQQVSWQNTGPLANINQSSQLTGGNGTFTVRDANGTVVYTGDLSLNGSFVSSPAGTPGTWTILIQASNLSGTASVRIQRGG
ncbi:MAG: hypothetical protein ACRENB_14535 [Gemmatimonadales bacterium]